MRPCCSCFFCSPPPFQFTHPRGVRRRIRQDSLRAFGRFNSRTREGCDAVGGFDFFSASVSIHAPARGATDVLRRTQVQRLVSIHAPARGATVRNTRQAQDFFVSIHAPARGATDPVYRLATGLEFQFTHPRGVRRPPFRARPQYRPFQFTHPRGVRQRVFARAQKRRDVSIHAPARGATVLGFIYLFLRSCNAFFAKYYIV